MWFDRQGARRAGWRRNRRHDPVLRVGARGRPLKLSGAAAIGGVAAAVLLCLVGVGFGVRALVRALFTANPMYTVRHMDFETEDAIARDYIRIRQGIQEGINIFSFSIRDLRRDFLSRSPNYRAMEVTRHLPNRLRIVLVEREPIARLGSLGGDCVDRDGWVFRRRTGTRTFPVIFGQGGRGVKPGDRVTGAVADAVAVLDLWSKSGADSAVSISGINVAGGFAGRPDDMRIFFENDLTVDLWWRRGNSRPSESAESLRERLEYLQLILNRDRADGLKTKTVNLTTDSFRENNAVTHGD